MIQSICDVFRMEGERNVQIFIDGITPNIHQITHNKTLIKKLNYSHRSSDTITYTTKILPLTSIPCQSIDINCTITPIFHQIFSSNFNSHNTFSIITPINCNHFEKAVGQKKKRKTYHYLYCWRFSRLNSPISSQVHDITFSMPSKYFQKLITLHFKKSIKKSLRFKFLSQKSGYKFVVPQKK